MISAASVGDPQATAVPRAVASAALERALADAGIRCTVEAHDRLAVIVVGPNDAGAFSDRTIRESALRLTTEHGFTHLALELPTPPQSTTDAEPGPVGARLPGA